MLIATISLPVRIPQISLNRKVFPELMQMNPFDLRRLVHMMDIPAPAANGIDPVPARILGA